MDRRFFHRLGASRLDRTICSAAGGAGLTATLGLSVRHRARAVPPLQADHRLGRERARHQRASVAVHRGGAAQRRAVLHHRSGSQSHRQAGRQAFRHLSGQRSGAGAGADARHHRRKAARRRLRRELHQRLRRAGRAGARVSAGARGATHGNSARRRGFAGARVRDHAAGGHPAELRNPAQRAWRIGDAGDCGSAGAGWIVARSGRRTAAIHQPGVSGQ